jgi:hypothetical protein
MSKHNFAKGHFVLVNERKADESYFATVIRRNGDSVHVIKHEANETIVRDLHGNQYVVPLDHLRPADGGLRVLPSKLTPKDD